MIEQSRSRRGLIDKQMTFVLIRGQRPLIRLAVGPRSRRLPVPERPPRRSNETKSALVQGANETLFVAVVAERAPGRADA